MLKAIKPDELQSKQPHELTDIILQLHEKEKHFTTVIESQQTLINALREQNRLLKHGKFGASSERYVDENPQDRLFDEAQPVEDNAEIEAAEREITIATYQRKVGGRKPLPQDLPRVEVVYDIAEHDKHCDCGCILTCIGDERSEQLDIIPEKIQVIVHIQKKYACRGCSNTIKTATKPQQPIPRSIASPGLLAHVLTRKYVVHLPLYRQEQMFHAIGVDIPRATLSHWVIRASGLLQPLVNLMQDDIRQGYDIAYADESTVQVLHEPGKSAESQSYMWCFAGGPPERFSYLYQYYPTRSHQVAIDFFDGFKGYLHCDGYQAYDNVAQTHKEITLVGCWYHSRRKFIDAQKVSQQTGVATYIVEQIQKLAKIEKAIQTQTLLPGEAKEYRETHARDIIDKIKRKLDDYESKVSSQSTLGNAIHYTLNQWPKLLNYLEDGRLEISNNRMERAMKPFALGRKNWLFANSVAGANASAIIYSLIETCKAHEVNPYDWLRYALTSLPSCSTLEQFEALLPYHFNKQKN